MTHFVVILWSAIPCVTLSSLHSNMLTGSKKYRFSPVRDLRLNFRSWKEQYIVEQLLLKYDNNTIPNKYKSDHTNSVKENGPTIGNGPNFTIFEPDPNPVIITTSLFINSIGTVKEVNMEFKSQFTLQQVWHDDRLKFDEKLSKELNSVHLAQGQFIWIPDTFFQNEKSGMYHTIDAPNFVILIRSDGQVTYNRRLSMTFSCVMDLLKYPMDTQNCVMDFASYAYTTDDIIYVWDDIPIRMHPKATKTLSNFAVKLLFNDSCSSQTATGNYSCLRVNLKFERVFSFFLIQLYLPTSMLVAVSWVSYWIDWRATAGRVPLAIVTLLTTITQSQIINANLPPVSYAKAVDIWIGACIVFVFGSLLEYAVVNYVGIRELLDIKKNDQSHNFEILTQNSNSEFFKILATQPKSETLQNGTDLIHEIFKFSSSENLNPSVKKRKNLGRSIWETEDLQNHADRPTLTFDSSNFRSKVRGRRPRKWQTMNSYWFSMWTKTGRAERIDQISRLIFPLCFLLFNVVYWLVYW